VALRSWVRASQIYSNVYPTMQRYTIYLYLETAVRVSGVIFTHHQERKQLYLQHLVFVTPLLLPSAIADDPQHKQRLFPLTAISLGLYNREAISRLRGWNQILVYCLDHVCWDYAARGRIFKLCI
jgi:hypothetical protein